MISDNDGCADILDYASSSCDNDVSIRNSKTNYCATGTNKSAETNTQGQTDNVLYKIMYLIKMGFIFNIQQASCKYIFFKAIAYFLNIYVLLIS